MCEETFPCIRCGGEIPEDSACFDDVPIRLDPEIYNLPQKTAGHLCSSCENELSQKLEEHLGQIKFREYARQDKGACGKCGSVPKRKYNFKKIFRSQYLEDNDLHFCKKHTEWFEKELVRFAQKILPEFYNVKVS